jgi:hypothetical protein
VDSFTIHHFETLENITFVAVQECLSIREKNLPHLCGKAEPCDG